MNTETRDWQASLAALRRLYEAKQIEGEALYKLLARAYALEIEKPPEEANEAFLTACQALMGETERELPPPQVSPRVWEGLQAQIRARETPAPRAWARRAGALAASLLLLLGGGALGRQWLHAANSPDGEQYIIQGQKNQGGSQAQAAPGDREERCRTDSLAELTAFLGAEPRLPRWLPEGWEVWQYNAIRRGDEFLRVNAAYAKEGEENLITVSYEWAADVTELSMEFEQNEPGKKQVLANGLEVYITYNYDNVLIVWMCDNVVYSVGGPINEEAAVRIVESMYQ